ncbi:MAG: hypothetical protein Q9167_004756 [Letrouitia subvulpina]
MDPFTAFSLVGTVLQFLDCGSRFISLARSLYQTGSDTPETYDHLIKIAKDLETILPELKDAKSAGEKDKDLAQLAVGCSKVKSAHHVDEKLTAYRKHVSQSLDQQDECLRRLGVVHDQTLNVGRIAASILERLMSKGGKHVPDGEVMLIQHDLVQAISTEADKFSLNSNYIQLSQPGRQRAQSLFKASLKYDDMIDRERRIATAHESTLQWVFHDAGFQEQQSRRVKWSNLREWLESDQQLYWITGKAGSGKSTLMKFLCSPTADMPPSSGVQEEEDCEVPVKSYRCHSYLKKWADPSLLVVASFYFWNSGKEMQMTQSGLLRTLLYQIISQCPEIIAEIAPKHWEEVCLFGRYPEHWPAQVLHDMLFQAVDTLSKTSKICLFVDGLDEFANKHEDLISMVKDLIQRNTQLKVCVASRPWNIFQDALGQGPSLRVEDLTFNDIKVFVESKFHADPEFEKLRGRYPSYTNQLIENIIVKASGVFLWVDLVVTSLLAGMTRGDRIQDFQQRLDELPPDLDKLYEKILYSLDQRYLEHAAQYFALVEAAEIPLTILQFAYADEESPESALKMTCGRPDESDISLRVEAMSRRLNSRCKGFLEIDRGLGSTNGNGYLTSNVTVQYLHRTVRDFIQSPKA